MGEHAVIRIKDNGVGMPAHMVENLFRQYYRGTTTDSSSEGTGLGMAIVYKLVQAQEGGERAFEGDCVYGSAAEKGLVLSGGALSE